MNQYHNTKISTTVIHFWCKMDLGTSMLRCFGTELYKLVVLPCLSIIVSNLGILVRRSESCYRQWLIINIKTAAFTERILLPLASDGDSFNII